jgi:hypothetical protein
MMHPPKNKLDLRLPLRIYLHTVRMRLKNTYWMTPDPFGQQKSMRIVEMMAARRETRVLTSSTRLRMKWER